MTDNQVQASAVPANFLPVPTEHCQYSQVYDGPTPQAPDQTAPNHQMSVRHVPRRQEEATKVAAPPIAVAMQDMCQTVVAVPPAQASTSSHEGVQLQAQSVEPVAKTADSTIAPHHQEDFEGTRIHSKIEEADAKPQTTDGLWFGTSS